MIKREMDLKQYPCSFKKQQILMDLGPQAGSMFPNTSANFEMKAFAQAYDGGQSATNYMGVKHIRPPPDSSCMFKKIPPWDPLKAGVPVLHSPMVKKYYNPMCA